MDSSSFENMYAKPTNAAKAPIQSRNNRTLSRASAYGDDWKVLLEGPRWAKLPRRPLTA